MNNLDAPEGLFCHNMITKAAKFSDDFYDWNTDYLKEYLDKNTGNNYVYVEYHYYELGRDEKWYKAQCKAMEGDMAKIKREILIEWTYASNLSIFTEEQLDNMSQYVQHTYKKTIYIDGYPIDILEDFNNMMYKNWVLSIDLSPGLGRDYTAFSLIDPQSLKMVMKFKNNLIAPTDFVNLLIKFVKIYVPNAVIVPERNNTGHTVIELLRKSDIGKNLYYTSSKDIDYTKSKIKKSKLNSSTVNLGTETREYGFNTDKNKREVMTKEILFMIANTRPELINNDTLFDEMRKLIYERSGKINHMQGQHDDLMFSYLIGLYILLYATNRNKFIKNISNEPVMEGKPKVMDKRKILAKQIMDKNNEEKMNAFMQYHIDPDLIEMQKLIDQRNENKTKIKADKKIKSIANIFKMNSKDW